MAKEGQLKIIAFALALLSLSSFSIHSKQYSWVIGITFATLSIGLRFLAANVTEVSTRHKYWRADVVLSISAVFAFLFVSTLRLAASFAINAFAYNLYYFEYVSEALRLLLLLTIILLILSFYLRIWGSRVFKEFEATLKNDSAAAGANLYQNLIRYARATMAIPAAIALLPDAIKLPLNVVLAAPRLLEHLERAKRNERLRPLFVISNKIDVEARLWKAAGEVLQKGRGLPGIWLPLYLLLPSSFFCSSFNVFLVAPVTLKVSCLLLLLPGLLSLFLVNTQTFYIMLQRVKPVVLILTPFCVLLILSLLSPSQFLLSFLPNKSSLPRVMDLRLNFYFLLLIVSSSTIFGMLSYFRLLAEESDYRLGRRLVDVYRYSAFAYPIIMAIFATFYFKLMRHMGVFGIIWPLAVAVFAAAILNIYLNTMFKEKTG